MTFRALLVPGRVLGNVEARSKKHALDILSELLASASDELEQGDVFTSLIDREKLGCTAIEHGVALPHGRLEGLERSIGAFLRLSKPVDFDAPDGEPVDLIFGLLVPMPADRAGCHLEEINVIAAAFQDRELTAALRRATSSRSLYDLLVHQHSPRVASA
jgi:PTS system nitrogen regulatory IIA component